MQDVFRLFKGEICDLSDEQRENRPEKFKNPDLQPVLDENDSQLQKRLADQLGAFILAILV